MFYNIHVTLKDGVSDYLGMYDGHFMCLSPNRNCVVWVKSRKIAQRIIDRVKKQWNLENIKEFEIKGFRSILR